MAHENEYLDYTGLQTVANEIKARPKIWKGDPADWDELPLSEKVKYDYVATDEEDSPIVAGTVPYDNTDSGLTSTNVQGAIDEVNSDLNALATKKDFYIFISDSYDDGAYDPNPDHKGWISQCAAKLGLSATQWTNQAQSGGSFQAGTWLAKLTSYRESITTEQANAVTKIVIGGGINDCLTDGVNNYSEEPSVEAYLTKLYHAIGDVSDYVKVNYPNALIYFCPVGYAWESSHVLYGRGILSRFVCYNYMRSAMADMGNYVCPTHTEFLLHEKTLLYSGDLLHPNNSGCIVLARGIAQAIRTGTCDSVFTKHTLTLTPETGITIQHFSSYEYVINEEAHFFMSAALEVSSVTALSSTDVQLGTLDLDLFQGNAFDYTGPIMGDVIIQQGSGNVNTRGFFTIYPGGEFKVHFEDIDPSSWAFKSYAWNGYLNIRINNIMIPSRLC